MKYILILLTFFSAIAFANLPPTQLKGGNETKLSTTFNFNLGAMPVSRTGTSVTFGTMPVSGGGTGLTSLGQYSILSGNGQSPVQQIAPSASGTILFSTGAGSFPSFRSLVFDDVTSALGYTPVEFISVTEPFYLTGPASSPTLNMFLSGAISGSTYTKVNVDGFGRVTSGTTLINSDLPDSGVAADTYTKVAVNSKGVVTSGTTLINSDLPDSGIVSGTYVKTTFNSKGIATSGTSLVYDDLPLSGVVSGTYTKVQVTSAGTITSGTTLVESDIPNLQTTKITSGVFTVSNGGTGVSSVTTGDLLVGSGTALIKLPSGVSGTVLTSDASGIVSWLQPNQDKAGINYLENGTFEQGLQGWVTSGTANIPMFTSTYSTPVKGDSKYATINTNPSSFECVTSPVRSSSDGNVELNFDYSVSSSVSGIVTVWDGAVSKLSANLVYTSDTDTVMNTYKAFLTVASSTTSLKTCFGTDGTGSMAYDNVYVGKLRSSKTGAIVGPTTSYTPVTQGFGTISSSAFEYMRVGDSIFIRGRFTTGTPTAVTAQIGLPNGWIIDSTKVPVQKVVGQFYRNGANEDYTVLAAGGNSFVTFGATTTRLQSANGSPFTVGSETESFVAGPIPILGLQGSGVTFDSTCPNDISCENVFSAKVSAAGVVSDDTLDFVNGNCTVVSAGIYSCLWNTGIFSSAAPNCTVSSNAAGGAGFYSSTGNVSTSGASFTGWLDNGIATSNPFTIHCQKSGADFKARQAVEGYLSKTVSTTGNGLARTTWVSFGNAGTLESPAACTTSPCTIYKNEGVVTSVTRSGAGAYVVNVVAGAFSSIEDAEARIFTTGGSNPGGGCFIDFVSSTVLNIFCDSSAAAPTDKAVTVEIKGYR